MLLFLGALLAAAVGFSTADADSGRRWKVRSEGGIETDLNLLTTGAPHSDHIELGGRSVNAIIKWSVDGEGRVRLSRLVRWPMIREVKDDTHAALTHEFDSQEDPEIRFNGKALHGSLKEAAINGSLRWTEAAQGCSLTREIFPSVGLPCILEAWSLTNTSGVAAELELSAAPLVTKVPREKLLFGPARITARWIGAGSRRLMPGETADFGLVFMAVDEGQPDPLPDLQSELASRNKLVERLSADLELRCGDKAVEQLFAFSKLRAAENVLATRGGPMHAPGGFNKYLAALWCNDQNEYVSPFFPFLGDAAGNESARTAYGWFSKYMNPEYKPIPSSIVAEGRGTWQGAGDRGDAAMTAYGASRWALATGDRRLAAEVWPFIQWCLEYCRRHLTDQGVVASNSDELEGRFSSGKTNLATSCLTYDALISASYLARELGEPEAAAQEYEKRAAILKAAIEKVFGAEVDGFHTYRYHEGLESLRSWICIPLAMDIFERSEGTINALLSPRLWTKDGLLTAEGGETYWDRSTLYALRGIFRAGRPDIAAERLSQYSEQRLLGDHVPYCVEAHPEGAQSQLSAESGLYCRILVEGAFGIRPTGFSSFEITPQLPRQWKFMELKRIHAFRRVWDCRVKRAKGGLETTITMQGRTVFEQVAKQGSKLEITLP